MEYKKLVLKAHEEKRILDGEFWAYDNELRGDLRTFQPGELCRLYSAEDMYIATGYVNPLSTIAFRVLSYDPDAVIDREFLRRRIGEADRQRRALRPENAYYRMVYGEADFLPGLVIDRFDDYFIVQVTTAGMENFKDDVFAIVGEMYPGAVLIEKSLAAAREKEGLSQINLVSTPGGSGGKGDRGQRPEVQGRFPQEPKNGLFPRPARQLPHAGAHRRRPRCPGRLCLCRRLGTARLPLRGAARRIPRDLRRIHEAGQGERRPERLRADRLSFVQDDAIKMLKEMSKAGVLKDIVILDPPAFVKSRSKLQEAKRGYKEINLRALKMLRPGGLPGQLLLLALPAPRRVRRRDP